VGLLSSAGIRGLSGYGDIIKGRCPFHEGSSGKTLWISVDTGVWGCWSTRCSKNTAGSLRSLFAALGFNSGQAENFVRQIGTLEHVSSLPSVPTSRRDLDEGGFLRESHIIGWQVNWIDNEERLRGTRPYTYVQSRGASLAALDLLGVGYDASLGALVFPLRKSDGSLCGIARREPEPDRKYYVSGSPYGINHPRYFKRHVPKGQVLWGYFAQREKIRSNVPVVVVEGFFDVVKLCSLGVCAVAKMGEKLTNRQVEILLSLNNPIVLWPDRDRAGILGVSRDASRLLSADVSCVLPRSADPCLAVRLGVQRMLASTVQPAEYLSQVPEILRLAG
jgi:hypothetical protein